MNYLCSVPAEIALLGRWGLAESASLSGVLNVRKYAVLNERVMRKGRFVVGEDPGDEWGELGFGCVASPCYLGIKYASRCHDLASAIALSVPKDELPLDNDRDNRIRNLKYGGVSYCSIPTSIDINDGLVVVKHELSWGQVQKLEELQLNYLNQIASAFDHSAKRNARIIQLGELLEQQHRVVAHEINNRGYCDFYNQLRLCGMLGGRLIGNCVFGMVKSEGREKFVALLAEHLPQAKVLPVEFSLRGAEVKEIS